MLKILVSNDDGYDSLAYDCRYLDMIHIDPWKEYPKFKDGLDSADVHAATSTGTVRCTIAAILDDV